MGRSMPVVTADGAGVVSHAGTVLLREVADRVGLTGQFAAALAGVRWRGGGHGPGRVAVDLAVVIADGGEVISDLRTLSDQAVLHGPVASTATAWRLLDKVGAAELTALRRARVLARERAWVARGEVTGNELPASRVAGRTNEHLVIDMDATLVDVHREAGRRAKLQGRVRVSRAAALPRQHQRGVGRDPAPGQLRRQRRRRSSHGAGVGVGATA